MSAEGILDLEDLARRYDVHVLREYLLDQEDPRRAALEGDDGGGLSPRALVEVYDLRPRCFKRLRALLVLNFFAYWTAIGYCGYVFHQRLQDQEISATPMLEVGLVAVFVLGTQATLEFAVSLCLIQPARVGGVSTGFHAWDFMAWAVGALSRTSLFLDALCVPLMYRASALLFVLSAFTFAFSIGVFVFLVELRLLLGLFLSDDRFSYDKPDLFFKGRDVPGMLEGTPLSARPASATGPTGEASDLSELRSDWSPPVSAIKAANFAHLSSLSMLHTVLCRLYIPLGYRETQEFVVSITSFSRCFCEDVVQCSVKFFFLMDCEVNVLVLLSFFLTIVQALASCIFASTASMDIRLPEDNTNE